MVHLTLDEILVDDSTDIVPGIGLKGQYHLDDRFAHRLELFTNAKVTMRRDNLTVSIYMFLPGTSLPSYLSHTKKFAEDLQSFVRQIAGENDGM